MSAHESLKIKPADGRRVRDPATGRPLAETATVVARQIYWERRLADGDVVLVPTKPAAKEA